GPRAPTVTTTPRGLLGAVVTPPAEERVVVRRQVAAAELGGVDPVGRRLAVGEVDLRRPEGDAVGGTDLVAVVAVERDALALPDDERVPAPLGTEVGLELVALLRPQGRDGRPELGGDLQAARRLRRRLESRRFRCHGRNPP